MRKVVGIVCLMAVLCSPAFAATYDWNGFAANGDIFDAGNWTVAGSTWTHPFEETGNYYTNEDVMDMNIANGDTVQTGTLSTHISLGVSTVNTAILNVTGGSTLNILGSLWTSDPETGVLSGLNVIDSALSTGVYLDIGNGENSVSHAQFINSVIGVGEDLKVANHAGATASLLIQNSTVVVDDTFYMNDAGGAGAYSELTMDSGAVTVANNSYLNDDAAGQAYFTMNGGTWDSGNLIDVSWNLDGISHLTLNGGAMTAGGAIRLGVSGGGDTGQSRVFIQGGTLQGDNLEFNMTDSLIVFESGAFSVTSSNLTAVAMQGLIDAGKIDVSGAPGYQIITADGFTTLIPEPGTMALVVLGSLLFAVRRRRS